MILVRVTHYLSLLGLQYFPNWFIELYDVIKEVDGFVDIAYRLDTVRSEGKIVLLFENEEKLNQWAKSDFHKTIIGKLDTYRTKPWVATRMSCEM